MHIQQIPSVTNQSVYTVADGTTRILAVLHDRVLLKLESSRSLDLLTNWQTAGSGEPEEWTIDKIPGATPLDFAIHPAPDTDGSEGAGLTVIRMGLPVNDDPPQHCYAYFVYKTAAIFLAENTEEHDTQAMEFFSAIADAWKELIID